MGAVSRHVSSGCSIIQLRAESFHADSSACFFSLGTDSVSLLISLVIGSLLTKPSLFPLLIAITQPICRLYTKGRILGHKRGKRNSRPNQSLVAIEGVDSIESATHYLGKVSDGCLSLPLEAVLCAWRISRIGEEHEQKEREGSEDPSRVEESPAVSP